jgi:hypothetical protein
VGLMFLVGVFGPLAVPPPPQFVNVYFGGRAPAREGSDSVVNQTE